MNQRITKNENQEPNVKKKIVELVKKIVQCQVRQARVLQRINWLEKQNLYLQQQNHIYQSRNQKLFSLLKFQKQKSQQESYQNIHQKIQELLDQRKINQRQNIEQKNIWIIQLLNQINQQRNMWMKKYEKMHHKIQEIKEQQMKKRHKVQIENDKLQIMVNEIKREFEQEKRKNYILQQRFDKNLDRNKSLASTAKTNKSFLN